MSDRWLIPLLRLAPFMVLVACGPAFAQWTPIGALVGYGPGDQVEEVIAPDGAGGAVICWRDVSSSPYRIRAVRITGSGSRVPGWNANGNFVNGAIAFVIEPEVVADGAGGAFVVWQDYRSGSHYDLCGQHILGDGSIAPGWAATGNPLCTAPGSQANHQLVADGSGGFVLCWYDPRNNAGGSGPSGIYLLRVNADGTVPAGWATDGNLVSVTGGQPRAVPDGTGGAVVGWYYGSGGAGSADVFALRMLGTGVVAPGWPAGGAPVCTAPFDQFLSAALEDGAGGAYFCWGDYRLADNRVHLYGQRVDGAGAIAAGWPAQGLPICIAPHNQQQARIATDGAGGAIFVWEDWRFAFPPSVPTNNTDIYAQRVTPAGIALWAANGVSVVSDLSPQQAPAVVSDGAGGVILSWVDYRDFGFPIYTQHLGPDGQRATGWAAQGAPLILIAAGAVPSMASDGLGGAIVTWRTYGAGDADIYAMRILSTGPVPVLVSLVSAEAFSDRVRLVWHAAGAEGQRATLWRQTPETGWAEIAVVIADGSGRVTCEDRAVVPGGRYVYRLGLRDGEGEAFSDETEVEIPLPARPGFAIERVQPNPADGPFRVRFALPDAAPATLTVLDVAGRTIETREVGALGAGPHTVTLGADAPLAPGLYLVRLARGAEARTRRLSVVR